MLKFGTKDYQFADKTWEADGTTYVKLVHTQEKYLYIFMPWLRRIYNINTDTFERRCPRFGIWWHKHPNHSFVTFARFGWC